MHLNEKGSTINRRLRHSPECAMLISRAATGFLFSHTHGAQTFPFVVTNKHVVTGMKTGAPKYASGSYRIPARAELHFMRPTLAWN